MMLFKAQKRRNAIFSETSNFLWSCMVSKKLKSELDKKYSNVVFV